MTMGLVIFDCDGVLVDSEPVANRILCEELRRLGMRLTQEEVCRRFIGLSISRVLEMVADELRRPVPQGFRERLKERTFAAFRQELRPVLGVREVLERLATPFCVASSGTHEKMRLTLGLTGLLGHFEGRMFSATQVARGKPHPDLFLHVAGHLGHAPAACVVVEDSTPGVRAARAAGMIALGYAVRGQDLDLAAEGATVFDDMARLPALLAELGAAR